MSVLIKPIITEKATAQSEGLNKYAFMVDRNANKLEIKQAVEGRYGVTVNNVNTVNYSGKRKLRYTKAGIIDGRTNHYKKAIITIADGEIIDFYSNI